MNNNNIYEIGVLINPDLSQQKVEKVVEKLKGFLTKINASVISEGEIVDVDLAYQIITKIASINERFDKAFFTWIKFEAAPSDIDALKKAVDNVKKDIFRYLIVKTVADDSETNKFQVESEEESEEEVEEEKKEEVKKEVKKEEVKEEVVEKEAEGAPKSSEADDLTKIEGIGPKTVEALNAKDISTYVDLAGSKVGDLRDILEEAGLKRYDPKSWSKQARLARDEKWDELKVLQDELNGGE